MFKQITQTIGVFVVGLLFAGQVHAGSLNVVVNDPKTPTNNRDFSITFQVLDQLNRAVTAKCFKQGPTDGAYVQYGGDIAIASGGNAGSCASNNSFMNDNGAYNFKVEVSAGADSASDTTSLTYNTSGPGDVRDYNKTHTNSCEYTIHFKTAEDSGKTVKVEVYRSENTTFNADNNSKVGTVNAGSNEAHDFTNTPPDCNKTYYYAVRAFDSAGNGSALVGDSVTTTVVNTTTTTQGAIATSNAGGSVLGNTTGAAGTSTSTGASGEDGQVQGDATPSAEPTPATSTESATNNTARNLTLGGGALLLGVLLYALWKKAQNKSV